MTSLNNQQIKESSNDEMIYIAAPYWHETESVREKRRQKIIAYSMMLTRQGILNYSPLLYTERYKKTKVPESYWIKHGLRMVEACDVVRVVCLEGWEESSGLKGEIKHAQELNKRVEYVEQYTRLAFCGSRSLTGDRTKRIIHEAIRDRQPELVVTHGEPEGVCTLAQEACRELGVPLKVHFLQLKRAAGKFHHRTKAVFSDSDYCVFIHDGVSQGCQNELEIAKKMKIPYEYHHLDVGGNKTNSELPADDGLLDVSDLEGLQL